MNKTVLMSLALWLGAALCASPAHAADPDLTKRIDLDARILVETLSTTADGVTHRNSFEESLMRRGAQVWKMRLNLRHPAHGHAHGSEQANPPAAKSAVAKSSEKFGHDHFNPIEFGRVVTLENDKPRLDYIKPERKLVVGVPMPEFENVGFDGSWHRAYYLITPAEMSRLKRSSRPSKIPGASWYERQHAEGYERVLWDASRAIALVLESGSADGKSYFRISVSPSAGLQRNPGWVTTKGYEQRSYSDYLD